MLNDSALPVQLVTVAVDRHHVPQTYHSFQLQILVLYHMILEIVRGLYAFLMPSKSFTMELRSLFALDKYQISVM